MADELLLQSSPTTRNAPIRSKYPMELGTPGPFEKWILFEAKSSRHVGRRGLAEAIGLNDVTLAAAQLYIPAEALNSSITASYDTNDIGPFMGVLSESAARSPHLLSSFQRVGAEATDIALGQYTKAAKDVGTMITNAVNAGVDVLKNVADEKTIRQAALASVLKMVDDKLGGGAVTQAMGTRINPRTDVLFSHVNYREHRMEYILIPRSEDEAREIDNIIKFFQFYMLPTYSPAVGINHDLEGMLIGFPYEFEISFWSDHNPSMHHFNKIGRSVLTNVAVDHAGGSQVAFFRTAKGELFPAVTKLSLAFQEVRLLARDEHTAQGSASGKGLIDRGNVGSFKDPGRDALAGAWGELETTDNQWQGPIQQKVDVDGVSVDTGAMQVARDRIGQGIDKK